MSCSAYVSHDADGLYIIIAGNEQQDCTIEFNGIVIKRSGRTYLTNPPLYPAVCQNDNMKFSGKFASIIIEAEGIALCVILRVQCDLFRAHVYAITFQISYLREVFVNSYSVYCCTTPEFCGKTFICKSGIINTLVATFEINSGSRKCTIRAIKYCKLVRPNDLPLRLNHREPNEQFICARDWTLAGDLDSQVTRKYSIQRNRFHYDAIYYRRSPRGPRIGAVQSVGKYIIVHGIYRRIVYISMKSIWRPNHALISMPFWRHVISTIENITD